MEYRAKIRENKNNKQLTICLNKKKLGLLKKKVSYILIKDKDIF